MIDIVIHCHALKVSCFARMLRSGNRGHAGYYLRNYQIDFDDLYKYGNDVIRLASQCVKNAFWKDVLTSTYYYLSLKGISEDEIGKDIFILSQPLWKSNFITVGNQPVAYSHWYKKGVVFINDLIDHNGDFYNQENVVRMYGIKTHFPEYHGLINSIKTSWSDFL